MGAEQYGLFNYLKVFYEKIVNFFDIGTAAFYPKLSQRPSDRGILRFVVLYDAVLFFGSFIMLGFLFISGQAKTVLTTESLLIAGSALLLAWILLLNQKMTAFMDAIGKTLTNEVVLLFMRITLTTGLVLLFIINRLNLASYLIIQTVIMSLFLFVLVLFAFRYFPRAQKSRSVKETAVEFKDYSLPLFWASLMGLVAGLADRWLLQVFGGATAQGYYSLGFNLGAICVVLTSSLTPLLMREYAIAHEKKDKDRLKHLFSKYLPLFFFVTAIISCFLAVHGDWLAPLIGGDEFSNAALPVMLLGLAPIHQTYGQLSGALMVTTDRTREYGKIDIFITMLGLPVTYFILAPENYGGVNLGAMGLAIKLVVLQVIAVNIQLWYNTRYLNISMKQFIIHQIGSVLLLITIAFTSKFLVASVLNQGIIAMLASGSLYITIVFVTILLFPGLIAMTRIELLNHINSPLAFLK